MGSLSYPIQDAKRLKNVLKNKYGFLESNIKMLENPKDKQDIENFLTSFNDNVLSQGNKEENNVLIFYAGHGFTREGNQGYWVPSSGRTTNLTTLLNTSTLQTDVLSGFNSKHNLVIVDACYSGAICYRGTTQNKDKAITVDDANKYYKNISQYAMTSGNKDQKVRDNSDFIKILVDYLDNNQEKYLSAESIYIKIFSERISGQDPKFCTLNGKENGRFIFQLKK